MESGWGTIERRYWPTRWMNITVSAHRAMPRVGIKGALWGSSEAEKGKPPSDVQQERSETREIATGFTPQPLERPLAIMSDLHANLEALEAVRQDLCHRGIEDVVCLGDIVNYGPDPEACIDIVMSLCRFTLMGNHEDAVLTEAVNFNEAATISVDWTRRKLARGAPNRWKFIEALPLQHVEGTNYFVHASPREPLVEYILPPEMHFLRSAGLKAIEANLEMVSGVCFVGHTHLPGVILADGTYLHPSEIGGPFVIDGSRKLIVNVGSVGQPRDQDPRACYVIYDGITVEYRRVSYDVERTMRKILQSDGLPAVNAYRLERGE